MTIIGVAAVVVEAVQMLMVSNARGRLAQVNKITNGKQKEKSQLFGIFPALPSGPSHPGI